MKRTPDFFRGCLVGGAIGDALGWPVEFTSYDKIVNRFGKGGIQDLQIASSGKAEITDDTQMTLFTAEGILRAEARYISKGLSHPPSVVFHAYQRWLYTQGYPKVEDYDWVYDGWLLGVEGLHAVRAPGKTCLSALSKRRQGTMETPANGSKGCGGIMRTAPAGLFYCKENAFKMAADFAALTHGHPSGYLSAGALAFIIASVIEGQDIETAVRESLIKLKGYKHNEECTQKLTQALALSGSNLTDFHAITELGEGWVGEEALGISAYCALRYQDNFKQALIAAVNHNGDSDSTGAITGNILGAYLGLQHIPADWIEQLELSEVVIQVADDLLNRYEDSPEWSERYPGY